MRKHTIMPIAIIVLSMMFLGLGCLDRDSGGGPGGGPGENESEVIVDFIEKATHVFFPEFNDPEEISNDDLIFLLLFYCEITPSTWHEGDYITRFKGEEVQQTARIVFGPNFTEIVHRSVNGIIWDDREREYHIYAYGPTSFTDNHVMQIIEERDFYIVDVVHLHYYTGDYRVSETTGILEEDVYDIDGNLVAVLKDGERLSHKMLIDLPARRYFLKKTDDGGFYISKSMGVSGAASIEATIKAFFNDKNNTNDEDWSKRSLTDMWNRVGGESAQFRTRNKSFDQGDKWAIEMPIEVDKIYQDLSVDILGDIYFVHTGFAYDYSYYIKYGSHDGLDIGAPNGTKVKFFTRGEVQNILNLGTNGYFVYVEETDASGNKVGRRWKFGHLQEAYVSVGQKVDKGTSLGTVGHGHLHLAVIKKDKSDLNIIAEKTGDYQKDVALVLDNFMTPLYAYWLSTSTHPQ